jgi:SAM-dependent methyltransferase
MSDREHSDLHKRWARLKPPLRPGPEVVEAVQAAVGGIPGRRLLLGVTRELALAVPDLVAADWSRAMIDVVWPGNAPGRCAVEADWLALPFPDRSFGAVLGDGSLNMLRWPDQYVGLMGALGRVIMPGGRAVIRCFVSLDEPERLEGMIAGPADGFHALKWRVAMAARQAGGNVNIGARAMWAGFETAFPDRDALAAATGWDRAAIDEIDDYKESPLTKSFPTRAELLQAIPDGRLIETAGYPLAERCPLLVIDFP